VNERYQISLAFISKSHNRSDRNRYNDACGLVSQMMSWCWRAQSILFLNLTIVTTCCEAPNLINEDKEGVDLVMKWI